MKRIIAFLFVFFTMFSASTIVAYADTYDDFLEEYKVQDLYDSMPKDAKNILNSIGVDGIDYTKLNDIKFEDIWTELLNLFANQGATPLKILAILIAIMLLYSVVSTLKTSAKTTSMEQVLSVCVTLCITCVIVIPVCSIIDSGVEVIQTSSKFMIAYIPIMVLVMASSGRTVSSASYYSFMIFAGEGVSQVSSNIVAPFLRLFLGLSVTSAVSPNVNLGGVVSTVSKITKWLLGFVMTIFTALLTFKQLITTAMDNVSTRAVRYTLTSFIPIVGSALSDAYKTVQSSVGLLKSNIGVFVIIAVVIVFCPALIQCLIWIFSLQICKGAGELLSLKEPCMIIEAVNTVITTIFAILLCIMSIFIISTAVILLLGGGGS